jgi:hypothetical protein
MVTLNVMRKEYHEAVCAELISYRDGSDVPGFIDEASTTSVELWRRVIPKLRCGVGGKKLPSDTVGQRFAELTREFIRQSLTDLGRPIVGEWIVSTSSVDMAVDAFGQHTTVPDIQRILAAYPRLRTELNRYCLIAPDIIVARRVRRHDLTNPGRDFPLEEEDAQPTTVSHKHTVDECLLHAVISCNWTVRGNRDERTPIEVLNLLRDRRGHTPHIVAVTFEPLPTRLASIALGTGDLDCLYHVALGELLDAIDEMGNGDHREVIQGLVQGRRLRDISDLPLDLAI